jgi:hypothetical protein
MKPQKGKCNLPLDVVLEVINILFSYFNFIEKFLNFYMSFIE